MKGFNREKKLKIFIEKSGCVSNSIKMFKELQGDLKGEFRKFKPEKKGRPKI